MNNPYKDNLDDLEDLLRGERLESPGPVNLMLEIIIYISGVGRPAQATGWAEVSNIGSSPSNWNSR